MSSSLASSSAETNSRSFSRNAARVDTSIGVDDDVVRDLRAALVDPR